MSAPLRILFVNRMAGMVRGGGETFDLEISNELARQGCDVTFLTGNPLCKKPAVAPTDTSVLPHEKIITLRSPYLPWFPWDKVKGGWRVRVWEFKQFEEKAAAWINRHADEYDVIQICELPYLVSLLNRDEAPGFVNRLRRGKPSTRLRQEATPWQANHPASPGGYAEASQAPGTKHEARITKHLPPIVLRLTAPNAHDPWGGVKLADAVIASGTSIDKVRRSLRPDVHDVPNGVDLARFQGGKMARWQGEGDQLRTCGFRAKHEIPANAPVLLYVARYQDFKKHRLLLEAFQKVLTKEPEVRLVLAGSGPLRQEAEALARRLGVHDRVLFLGEVSFADLPSVYAAADIKVISSEYESFCFAAIEAMASGLPVVTTDCGWVPKLIGDSLPPIEKQWAHGGDAPGRTGLGTSSAFTVGLLHVLHALHGERVTAEDLAREAIHVERDRVGDAGGWQDQYAAAYGGFLHVTYEPGGRVSLNRLALGAERLRTLEERVMIFFTGLEQSAETLLREQQQNAAKNEANLVRIKELAVAASEILASDADIDVLGELFHESWMLKRTLSYGVSTDFIDGLYETARKAGATGGKLLGAGGRGFLLLWVPPERQPEVKTALSDLQQIDFACSNQGSRIIFQDPEG